MQLILFSLTPSPLSNLTNSLDLCLLFPMLSIDKYKQSAAEASLRVEQNLNPTVKIKEYAIEASFL